MDEILVEIDRITANHNEIVVIDDIDATREFDVASEFDETDGFFEFDVFYEFSGADEK